MRPIPAPRLGDTHGLLRAINQRDRVRLDEFITEFSVEELFPPGLENALGRTRQFVSFARSAGLLNEDRGVVELTEVGKRYVRSGDEDAVFDVSSGQAEWLRRQLRERHMTDSIYHGAAIGLSLYASNPPDFRVSRLDFGRALAHLGRAGWDNENTLESQGERYTTFLRDLELIDDQSRLTETGTQTKARADAARSTCRCATSRASSTRAGSRRPRPRARPSGPPGAPRRSRSRSRSPRSRPPPSRSAEAEEEADEPVAPPAIDTGEYEDVAGAGRPRPPPRSPPAAPSRPPTSGRPPRPTRSPARTPPSAPSRRPRPRSRAGPAGGPRRDAAEEPAADEDPSAARDDLRRPARGGVTSGDPLAQPEPVAVEAPAGAEPAEPEVGDDAPRRPRSGRPSWPESAADAAPALPRRGAPRRPPSGGGGCGRRGRARRDRCRGAGGRCRGRGGRRRPRRGVGARRRSLRRARRAPVRSAPQDPS